ncbi:MAG: hypothetical protein K1060chlam2_01433 [Chlamydiae bacterium]|nr:hypothetical protein [Chlamydiota bacterium]
MSSASISNRRGVFFLIFLLLALPRLYAVPNDQNGLPNISTRTESSSSSWAVSADFLFWFASEEVTSIWADVITVEDNRSSWGAPGFDFNWDYGFRIGVGYNLIYDQWDTVLYWTWFRTDAKHSLSSSPNVSLHPEFFAAFLSGDSPRSMSVDWSILFNMFDWELGRSYWVSENLSLRPFLGIKGGWINQSIDAHYHDLIIDLIFPTNHSGRERLKNNFWGVGPTGGINSKWRVYNFGSHFFDLFGDFSVATMWGQWTCNDVYKNTLPKKSTVNTKNSTLGALMFRGFMGIGWEADFHEGSSHFTAKLGYEMQFWLNQLRLATFQLQRLHGDLTLQGVTLHCRFDF